ncbi:hypothetical protein PILCRDRAFT_784254 [Piloderma croceum F 1598]|uniref:Carbohydrate-binding module family 19 domain-containing protein n=1 Tax=Piloderma croceum (strain F 1598) TaxID=765440 RepID=A0A0C3C0E2_PILCF|nr:hypothetical protein PILCRDRAFT_784254 [Piloderma croceum F 1598]
MVYLSVVVAVALAATSVNGVPLTKRIAQVIADSTTKWEAACDKAGGGEKCNPVAVAAFGTLLAAPGPCEQQDAADNMIDLAKTLKNDPDMIKFAQLFAQQPRNSPNSQSVPYCQQAPKNSELNGLFQCQFQGDDPKTFVGGAKAGSTGTIPFGMSSPVSPAGSCKANTSGPIKDGSQLTDITSDPGVTSGTASASTSLPIILLNSGSGLTSAAAASGTASSGGFKLQNGKDAQKLNAKFSKLTTSSSCNEGDQACVNNGFAQCVGGKFQVTQCAASTTCAALPLVNSKGTSIACTTQSDAEARIKASGATGGLTGSGA